MSTNQNVILSCILDQIPWHKNHPEWISKEELTNVSTNCCSEDKASIIGYVDSIILILNLLDLIDIKDQKIRVKGQIQFYFINSLKWYIKNDEKLLSNWDRPGVAHDININNLLEKAPYLLKLLEQRKKDICQSKNKPLESSRQQRVSIVLVKTIYKKSQYYLFQWDNRSEQFQLIGGRGRDEETILETAKREFNEELQLEEFIYGKDYTLEPLVSDVKISDISRTFGALTDYDFSLFLAKIKVKKIKLTKFDRWISVEEMEKGITKDGKKITDILYFKAFDKNLPDGFKGIENSLKQQQVFKFWEHIEVKPSFFGISINIISLITSLLEKK